MATANPFDLLGDDDAEDPSLLVAAAQLKIDPKKAAKQQPTPPAKLPTKPPPPAQAVRESKSESARGGRGGARGGRGRGNGGGSYRDSYQNDNSYGNREFSVGQGASDDADAGKSYERRGSYGGSRGSFRGGRKGGYSNGDAGEDRPRRPLDRRSGTGYGYEPKREGAGRGNWGTQTDEVQVAEDVVPEGEKPLDVERPSGEDATAAAADGEKEASPNEVEEKEPEEMTLEEYEKVLEEKRKALQALKTDSRKVDAKEFESMQQLSNKKAAEDIFIKLGSEKDKKKELAEKEERAKKSVSINEFLKPAEGEKFYNPGRGRGRGRGGPRGGYGGGAETSSVRAPAIEDPGQFPTLGGK